MGYDPELVLQDDVVNFHDHCCVLRDCWGDIGLSSNSFSTPPPTIIEKDRLLKGAVAAGAEAIRPGVKPSEVHAVMAAELGSTLAAVTAPQGHGVGLELREIPHVMPATGGELRDDCIAISADTPLEAGMLVNLEIHCLLPGVGALQNERSFLVTSGGSEYLIDFAFDQEDVRIVGADLL